MYLLLPSHFPVLKKTRLAPTPSGYLHLGNVLSFVLTLTLARRCGASVLLRIDDMDRQRAAPAFVNDLFETLRFLDLPYDEGPVAAPQLDAAWSQLHREVLYSEALQHLIAAGAVYACTCSRTDVLRNGTDAGYPGTCRDKGLPLDTPDSALRVRTPAALGIVMRTLAGEHKADTLPASMRDFVVRKKGGEPAYQVCSVVDDLHFGVDLVVRGADLWPSTLAQLWLSSLLPPNPFAKATFVHHTLLTSPTGEKLSKSAGSTSVFKMRKQGMSRADMYRSLIDWLGLKVVGNDWQSVGEALLERQDILVETTA